MSTVIQVENLSKQYRLGLVGSGTFKEDASKWWAKIRRKEDPFKDLGEENDRTKVGDSNYVWSLKDINFEVQQGDVLGIVGRNGAGKSTLLKILSKVTAPTTGTIKAKGRIASLLEVGTGFHPELTGRENIFLNGAILGMRRYEIKAKLDEIIAFAGVERYIDTPVKRYSSGMYVRLAFAVAAHLENEILIVDEVLAVGDTEFQKKCLGKMGEISQGQGKTVLFVSHNINAVNILCNKGIFLENGKIKSFDEINKVIDFYIGSDKKENNESFFQTVFRKGNKALTLYNFKIFDNKTNNEIKSIKTGDDVVFKLFLEQKKTGLKDIFVAIGVNDRYDNRVMYFDNEFVKTNISSIKNYIFEVSFIIPSFPLVGGEYSLTFFIKSEGEISDWITSEVFIKVRDGVYFSNDKLFSSDFAQFIVNYKIELNEV